MLLPVSTVTNCLSMVKLVSVASHPFLCCWDVVEQYVHWPLLHRRVVPFPTLVVLPPDFLNSLRQLSSLMQEQVACPSLISKVAVGLAQIDPLTVYPYWLVVCWGSLKKRLRVSVSMRTPSVSYRRDTVSSSWISGSIRTETCGFSAHFISSCRVWCETKPVLVCVGREKCLYSFVIVRTSGQNLHATKSFSDASPDQPIPLAMKINNL